MIPTTYAITMALTILTMICWGSWANTTKMAKGYRFELFYFDYSIAVFLVAVAAALTFGMMDAGTNDAQSLNLSFMDNLATTYKSNIGFAMIGGAVFNLANMLLVAAIGVAGMAVAFPIGIGLALIGGAVLSYFVHPAGSAPLLFCGVGLVFMAIVVSAFAHATYNRVDPAQLRAVPSLPLDKGQAAPRKASPLKGIALSLASGVLMAAWYPLVELGKRGELPLGPYTAAFCFSLGVLITTPVYSIFFMKVPVEGKEVEFKEYFRARPVCHLIGLFGGLIWTVGTIANFVAASAPSSVNVGPAIAYALGQGAALISTLWGLFVWREFKGAKSGVVALLALMLTLYVAGLGLVAIAPLQGK
jgi:glucose uptake protein